MKPITITVTLRHRQSPGAPAFEGVTTNGMQFEAVTSDGRSTIAPTVEKALAAIGGDIDGKLRNGSYGGLSMGPNQPTIPFAEIDRQ